jgi:hypothetical protein
MFVGVDEYDAPARVAFDGSGTGNEQARLIKAAEIESFFKKSLFSILRTGCSDGPFGCIDKFFVTGVLPVFRADSSPLSSVESISEDPRFFGICGLTNEQVRIITEAYLYPVEDYELEDHVTWIRKLCSGYYFGRSVDELNYSSEKKKKGPQSDNLYNPHLAFQFLSGCKSNEYFDPAERIRLMLYEPRDWRHVWTVISFKCDLRDEPKNGSHYGMFWFTDYRSASFGVMHILRNIELTDLAVQDERVALSLLVYLGVLTADRKAEYLFVPNFLTYKMVITYIPWPFEHPAERFIARS